MMQNKTLSSVAYGKINLYLDVLSKMENGYHNIESVMQSVSLGDTITLSVEEISGDNQIEIYSSTGKIPTDKSNLVYKTASSFFEETKIKGKLCKFKIEKNIPISAGMAGGSSDGACAMKLLNEYFGSPLTHDELCKIGSKIGADIPFCLTGGTCITKGIGEKITPIARSIDLLLVCAIDDSSVSTPVAFSMLDERYGTNPQPHGGLKKMCTSIESGNIIDISNNLFNKFESVIIPTNDNINTIKSIMIKNGALGALMSGSGPSVFGIFDNEFSQRKAFDELQNCSIRAFLCKTI